MRLFDSLRAGRRTIFAVTEPLWLTNLSVAFPFFSGVPRIHTSLFTEPLWLRISRLLERAAEIEGAGSLVSIRY